MPLGALLAGGGVAVLLPGSTKLSHRRGETGVAQVRLELAAEVLNQTQQMLRTLEEPPIDEQALIERAAERACSTCVHREECTEAERVRYLPQTLLHQSAITLDSIPSGCRQPQRLLPELQHGRDQYRLLLADRQRQQEYRSAVIQQYGFLSEYLQELSDHLPRREEEPVARFEPEVAVCSRGREAANGDRCLWFAGTRNRYYVLLCDGMGTGEGAAYEAKTAGYMLRRMLMAGYPTDYALQSLNSLCVLRGSAGAVTVDLVEADLVTGRAALYKWGAAPSWLLGRAGPERIGREGPPPGISLEQNQGTVDALPAHGCSRGLNRRNLSQRHPHVRGGLLLRHSHRVPCGLGNGGRRPHPRAHHLRRRDRKRGGKDLFVLHPCRHLRRHP